MNSSRSALPGALEGLPAWALPWVLSGVCVGGSTGNLLLLRVLARQEGGVVGGPGRAWLLHLCSADLLLALGCLPARIAAHARRSWPLGGFLCRATQWLLHGCLVAKSLTWAALAHAHCRPPRGPPDSPGGGTGRLLGTVASVWLSALLLPLPVLLFTRLEGGRPAPLVDCVFRTPAYAANFMDVFSKVYPLLAYLAPAGFTWACYGRALRRLKARQDRLAQPRRATQTLLALSLLFQAMWLPEWGVWLWERHGRPPPALVALAEVLVFLNGAVNPAVFAATSEECRAGLRSLWPGLSCGRGKGGSGGARAAETPQALQELRGEAAAEKVLPDVEHFWKDRRNAAAGEESDPIPWERHCDP